LVNTLKALIVRPMPLGLIAGLPAGELLAAEGVQILPLGTPAALKLLCLNLMPLKESTERQLGRNFGQSHITVDLHFAMPDTASGKNSNPEHLSKYYSMFSEAVNQQWDGVIVTGAPIEHLPFEEVNYWPEMIRIMDWIKEREIACYYLCWGAFAALNHYYGIPMHPAPGKLFGLYPLEVVQECEMTEKLQMPLSVPVSRHTYLSMDDMHRLDEGVSVVLDQKETGPCVMWDSKRCFCYMMNHFEYEVAHRSRTRKWAARVLLPHGALITYVQEHPLLTHSALLTHALLTRKGVHTFC
jgi:homoserine O-succinyltransferase